MNANILNLKGSSLQLSRGVTENASASAEQVDIFSLCCYGEIEPLNELLKV